MERKAEELGIAGQVRFLGLRKDIPELLGALDGFLLPSLYEGLGIVLIEAQAAGVPCLVSEEVPREADLELGMISRLPADDTAERWAEGIAKLAGEADIRDRGRHKQRSWQQRAAALSERGYNIEESAAKLERMYAG